MNKNKTIATIDFDPSEKMKFTSLEKVLFCAVFVLAALLFRCGCGDKPVTKDGKEIVRVQIDTLIVEKKTLIPQPYKSYVYLHHTDTVFKSDTFNYGESALIETDTIREYLDSISSSAAKAWVKSVVNGNLISQNLKMESYNRDTTFVMPEKKYSLAVGVNADLLCGFGAGVQVGMNRMVLGYSYYPFTKSHAISLSRVLILK